MKKIFILVCLILSFQKLLAQVKDSPKMKSTPQVMSSFVDPILGLQKYVGSDENFKDPKNAAVIEKFLKDLVVNVKEAGHQPVLASENFKFSRQVLEEHLVEMERVFRVGNKSYARWMASATMGICMSCHMQMKTPNKNFQQLLSLKSFKTDFEKAHFLFTARDYSQANAILEKLIMGYPKTKLSAMQLDEALHRQAAYFSRVLRAPQQGADQLSKFLTNSKLPDYDRINITNWVSQFKTWTQVKMPDPSQASAAEVISFAKKYTDLKSLKEIQGSDPLQISYLFVSGILYEYLYKHPSSSETPELLYWLAVCDRGISNEFFYSLADVYLRECMIQFPSAPIAAKCFKEYESNMILGYTGSSGLHLPAEVREDLKRMKEWIDTKGKIEQKKVNP